MPDPEPRTATGASNPLVVGFDGDDTLWHNERAFKATEERFHELVAPWATRAESDAALIANERVRVEFYGFGVKSFALSMVATALELSNDEIGTVGVRAILGWADELLAMPTELIPGARRVLDELAQAHRIYIITKGDLSHQQRRIDASGLRSLCTDVEVVGDKSGATYRRVLDRHDIDPAQFVMVGNSVSSDIQPVLDIGGRAIHVPYEVTWALEVADDPTDASRWRRAATISEVPALIQQLT